jgi:hypothetical protein
VVGGWSGGGVEKVTYSMKPCSQITWVKMAN